jgi:hypothetical protein
MRCGRIAFPDKESDDSNRNGDDEGDDPKQHRSVIALRRDLRLLPLFRDADCGTDALLQLVGEFARCMCRLGHGRRGAQGLLPVVSSGFTFRTDSISTSMRFLDSSRSWWRGTPRSTPCSR